MKGQKTATLTRRKYDEEFKRNALQLLEQGQSVRSVSLALGIAEGQLHKWKRAARRHASPDQQEVAELRAQLRQLQVERDILKKALAIYRQVKRGASREKHQCRCSPRTDPAEPSSPPTAHSSKYLTCRDRVAKG